MSNNRIERNIVFDEPSNEDQFHGKGHERTAFALSLAIAEFNNEDRAIGLDGPWGSGKSSVVEMAEAMLKLQNKSKPIRYSFFTFDLWKAQGSIFRRSYLEHFLTWAKNNYPEKRKQLLDIEQKVTGKTREIETDNKPLLDWFGIVTILLLPFLPIYYFWAKTVFDDLEELDKLNEFFYSSPFWVLMGYILVAIGKSAWDSRKSNGEFKTNLTKTLLLSSRRHEDQKLTQTIRETDPNDYEFQKVFREILAIVQSKKDRVVVVLDNIDRLPKNDILENWAQMRAVFSHNVIGSEVAPDKAITAIIPYDRKLVENATDEWAYQQSENSSDHISKLDERELFAKTFDEILVVSPPVMSSTRAFFTDNLKLALPHLDSEEEIFRSYLVLKQISDVSKRALTPRQIINFINELTGLYALHDGQFGLPTIAVFIAYRDKLEENPNLLTKMDQLGDRIRRLADDPELERNLAAIVFNVEPALAFQVLLAPQINVALCAHDSEHIEELSEAAGFEVTIVETIQSNGQEWASAGDLYNAIDNVEEFFEKYRGQAKEQIALGLLAAFKHVKTLYPGGDEAQSILALISMVPKTGLSDLGKHLIDCAFADATQDDETLFVDGSELIEFLDDAWKVFKARDAGAEFEHRLDLRKLKDNGDFIVGAASAAYERDISISNFHMLPLSPTDEYKNCFTRHAVENPENTLKAVSELDEAKLMPKELWPVIANTLVEHTKLEAALKGVHIELLKFAWKRCTIGGRGTVALEHMYETTHSYDNIHRLYFDEKNQISLTSFLFLAGCKYPNKELPIVHEIGEGGALYENESEAVLWFKEIFAGENPLSEDEYGVIAQDVKDVNQLQNWTTNASNQLDAKILQRAYLEGSTPYISLSTILDRFDYLKEIFGVEDLSLGFSRIGKQISEDELNNIEISNLKIGVLAETSRTEVTGWDSFHNKIGELLNAVPTEDWTAHIINNEHITQILIEKTTSSGLVLDDPKFRTQFIGLILGILNGSITPQNAPGTYDILIDTISENFHGDILREVREKMSDVTSSTIVMANQQFPELLGRIISEGKPIMANEKHNVIRYLLCSALEAEQENVLSKFNNLGYSKVSDYLKKSDETTQNKVKGAYDNFAKTCDNEDLVQKTGATIYGKTKSKSILQQMLEMNPLFRSPETKDES